jgi:hypothetical protein
MDKLSVKELYDLKQIYHNVISELDWKIDQSKSLSIDNVSELTKKRYQYAAAYEKITNKLYEELDEINKKLS